MKIKSCYKLRKMCGSSIVVAVGKNTDEFNGMVTLNESGELLWNTLAQGATDADLVKALIAEYGIDAQTAAVDVDEFIKKVEGAGFLE